MDKGQFSDVTEDEDNLIIGFVIGLLCFDDLGNTSSVFQKFVQKLQMHQVFYALLQIPKYH